MSDTEPLPIQPPNGHPQHSGHGPTYPQNGPASDPRYGYPPNEPGPRYNYPPNEPGPRYDYPPNGPGPGYGQRADRPGPAQGYAVNPPAPGPASRASDSAPHRGRPRDGSGTRRTALVIQSLADVAAVFLGLWIVLYMLDANLANPFVGFVQGVAEWLGWWAQDIFTMSNEGVRVFLNYGLPAGMYLLVGHGLSTWMRRL